MDRASWFTSQELGILFHSRDIATAIASAVSDVLSFRRDPVFLSTAEDGEESEQAPSREQSIHQGNPDTEGGRESKTWAPRVK